MAQQDTSLSTCVGACKHSRALYVTYSVAAFLAHMAHACSTVHIQTCLAIQTAVQACIGTLGQSEADEHVRRIARGQPVRSHLCTGHKVQAQPLTVVPLAAGRGQQKKGQQALVIQGLVN